MARSMVSIGTAAARAFWNMVRRVGLESGSPPPSRAATSTCRMSLANSFPRALSAAPFLCLMVAHLLWPDMTSLLWLGCAQALEGTLQEQTVQPGVARQLGVERSNEHRPPPAQYDALAVGRRHAGQDLDPGPDPLDGRGPDEHGVERLVQAG